MGVSAAQFAPEIQLDDSDRIHSKVLICDHIELLQCKSERVEDIQLLVLAAVLIAGHGTRARGCVHYHWSDPRENRLVDGWSLGGVRGI